MERRHNHAELLRDARAFVVAEGEEGEEKEEDDDDDE